MPAHPKTIYRLFDVNDREVVLHNTEDKEWWLKEGEAREREFLQLCAAKNILKGDQSQPGAGRAEKESLPA